MAPVIPRIFHHIWLGEEPFPEHFEGYRQSWVRNHPDWLFRFWTEDNLPGDLVRPEVYDLLRSPVERADILRFEVLNREGGVYVDTDFESLRPLDPLLAGVDFFCAYLKPGRVNNAILGSTPHHPVVVRGLEEMAPRKIFGYDMKEGTGPFFFDRLIKAYPDVTIFEPEAFYPTTPDQRRDAVAVHHASRTWKPRDLLMGDVERAEEKLGRAEDQLRELERRYAELRSEYERLRARSGSSVGVPPGVRKAGSRAIKRLRRDAGLAGRRAYDVYGRRNRSTYAASLERVPNRDELPEVLNRRQLLGEAVQVGLGDGAFADGLLTRWRGLRLYCVDDSGRARRALKKHGKRAVVWRTTSLAAADRLADASLDFIHLDMTRDGSSLAEDLAAWLPKLRPGGILAGSPYDGRAGRPRGPEQVIREFAGRRSLEVFTTTGMRSSLRSWMVEVPRR